MFFSIQNTVLQLLPARRRRSPSGWISFDAVCCYHRGQRADTRGRGGIITGTDGAVTYHCFNCNFKAGYKPGNYLGYKFRRFLGWLGADDNTINRLVIESVRIKDSTPLPESVEEDEKISFKARPLPDDCQLVDSDPIALEYCQQRAIDLNRYPLLVSNRTEYNLNRRVIVPFTWQGHLIGYTSRSWDPAVKPKYYSNVEANYVYNIDMQNPTAKFAIVCEGPFDAMSIDGIAILGNECSETQMNIIDNLNREIILVPDVDRAGAKLIDSALDFGWSVSFPIWQETCKDINQAVIKYGKLFVLKSILVGKESSRLKIGIKRKLLLK